MRLGVISAAFGAAILLGSPAQAMFVDFTSDVWGGREASDPRPPVGNPSMTVFNAGGPGIDVTATLEGVTVGNLDTTEGVTNLSGGFCLGTRPGVPDFACDHDGIGAGFSNADIDRDEIDGDEVLKITLSEVVEITAIYLLDFFFALEDNEIASVDFDGDGIADQTFTPEDGFSTSGNGFAAFVVPNVRTSMLAFFAGDGNDLQGVGDFALAGIEFNPVEDREIPVPAALPLLLTGLFGLGFIGRRRRAAT